MTVGTAGGKVILFGEHAVVYGRPAIALPVSQVRARAEVLAGRRGQGIRVVAPDLGRAFSHTDADQSDPLALTVRLTLGRLGIESPGDLTITVHSDLPVARGLGSGAAVSTALVRALAAHFGRPIGPEVVSGLVFEAEKLHHGTPSGIDNTVIAFEGPVYFVKDRPPEVFSLRVPFTLVIGDTGIASSTRQVVGDVRAAWQADRLRYEALFDEIGRIAQGGRACMEAGEATPESSVVAPDFGSLARSRLGDLMNQNHALLQQIGVSSPELDQLVSAARDAGALGAKLCGAGRAAS